jgi:hypothetical protein
MGSDSVEYEVTVVTGKKSGAGTGMLIDILSFYS